MKSRLDFFLANLAILLVSVYAVPSIPAETFQDEEKSGVYLNEIGIGTGYAQGSLRGKSGDLSIYPLFVRFGFNVNSLAGIDSRNYSLQFICEPFVNAFYEPEDGIEAGCSFGLRYLHEVSYSIDLFLEASVGPMYYSIDTIEQGKAGFNFLDQIGAGLQYQFTAKKALFGGYRWRHISHAGLADRSNEGINSNAFIIGFTWLY